MLKLASMHLLGGSRIRKAILEELAGKPDRAIHGRELARRLGVSQPAVSRVLTDLESQGVLVCEIHGRRKAYSLARSPIAQNVIGLLRSA